MKELVKIVFVLAFMLLLCVGNLSAQYAKLVDSKKYSKTEMSLFNASVDYFELADYANAYMGFSQLHSWYAADPVFSYYCGATMVMLRNEYDKAIKYLNLAYDNKLYEADYYLALAYHRKYLFTKAITYYVRYKEYLVQTTKGKPPKIVEIESLIEKANQARSLGQESYVLKVMSNNKVKRSNFHFSYGRKILDGNLVVKPDFFRQRNDKNIRDIDLVYVLDTIAFVSSFGSDMKTGLDLYFSRKTEAGWSPLQLLSGNVNSNYDEAFPFLASDGTLYFASKGHNSIGGYDIFKSVYDAVSGQWGEPENLGFPINTPYDDFMYAIESNGNSAFFASDRSSKDGQVMVCRYILEDTPEKIHIETEEHLAEQAELPVTPGAETEYNRILQEQKNKSTETVDSVSENKQEVKHEIDTTDLFVSTKSMLDEKVSAVSGYNDYAKKLNAYARITSNKIRAIRNGEAGANMSASDVAKMANSVVTYYDLSQKFNAVYSTAKPTLDYCQKEVEFLNKLETGSGEYQFKLQNLNISVEKVNVKSPLQALIEEKRNDKKQAEDALKKFGKNMNKDQKSLREINAKLESKMQQIQNETDPEMRERYINEHKALENSKVDVIRSIKNMQVEARRLNTMIERADESIKMLEGIEDVIANLDLSQLDDTDDIGSNDILALQNFISDEDEKETTEYEKTVEEDESMYSEKIDYEAIVVNNHADSKNVTKDVYEYKDNMSKSTSAIVDKMVQRDSLYSEKSRLEALFDSSDSDEEKTVLLNGINSVQKQISEKEKDIESDLAYESNSYVTKAIDDYNAIKQMKVSSEDWPDLVSSTQNLIEKSQKLEKQISEKQSAASTSPYNVKLLEKVKSDVDNQIVSNVEEMQGIVVAQQSGKRDIVAMNAEIAKIRSSAKDKSAENEVKKVLNYASRKVVESKQVTSDSGTSLDEAENILSDAVEKQIAILNGEYEAENKVYDVLTEKYVKSKSTENKKQQADVIYYSALEDRQQAESVTDEVEKMKLLSEANKKIKSANATLLQVVSPDAKLDAQTNDELTQDILSLYNDIKEQKGSVTNSELVEGREGTTGKNDTGSNVNNTSSLQTSVTRQTDLSNRIATNDSDITVIATNMATAGRSEKKRLETTLGEVISERDDNVRSLGEEKQRFYAELDRSKHDEIAKTSVFSDYTDRYADYRQSLYSLTNAEPSDDVTEKLADAEKSEYALLQTIIPNVDTETRSVLHPIYSELAAKYGSMLPTELVDNSTNPPTEPVDNSRPLSIVEVKGNETSPQNAQQNGIVEGSGSTVSSQTLQTSVTRQTDLSKRIATNDSDITTIATNMATAGRSEKKRLETTLGEVISERDDNVRSLGEEKQRFYAELDRSKHDDIAKTSASTDYTNRYADYRQSLYSLTNAEPSDDVTEKLADAEKSEYALLQTIIPNVDSETKSVLQPIYSELDSKYGNISSTEFVDNSTNPPAVPVDTSRPLSVVEGSGNETSPQNAQQNGIAEGSGSTVSSQTLQTSVTRQTDLSKRIATNDIDITAIATNMATAGRSEKKRLETTLGEVISERDDNVRSLGEEKQRFYAELDRSKHDEIAKTSVFSDYTDRYADYRQSLYSLTNAEPSADMTEKLVKAEKSEYALLQTIIPNVDIETKSVLQPIYSELDAKYGNISHTELVDNSRPLSNTNPPTEPVEVKDNETSTQNAQQNGIVEGSGSTVSSQSLQTSVTRQTDLSKRIATNDSDITTIATNMATAGRSEKKRLETTLGEVISERDDNVRSLGEEKQRFYAELDKSKHDDIAKTSASTDYTNRYADYRQSLYSLTNAEPSADMTEKLVEAEKSEYALLQAIIPNVDIETKSVLQPIYSELDSKYGNISHTELVDNSRPLSNTNPPTEPVEVKDNEISSQNAQQNGVAEGSGSTSSQSLQTSVTRQTDLSKRIATNDSDITTIATNMATAGRSEKKRLETSLGEVISERDDNVRSLGEEKQRFYAELDKSKHDEIAKTSASTDYTNRYADYRQSLYSLTNAEPSADMTEKLVEAEKSEYALLQTIIPNVDTETRSVLQPIYSELAAKYGNISSAEPVGTSRPLSNTNPPTEPVEVKDNEISTQNAQQNGVAEGSGSTVSSQSLQTSVTRQTDLSKRIATNDIDITAIATNMATAGRSEKKRLETTLGEVISERDDNVRSLGEEKQRFYAELDKSKHDEIAKTSASTDYTNRYTDYRQSLYSLTNAEPSDDVTEKLVEAEKSEYALLQTIIPNVDTETRSVLQPIYSELAAKYGNISSAEPVGTSRPLSNTNPPTEPVEVKDNEISTQNAQQNGVAEGSGSTVSSQSLQTSVTRQTDLSKRIATNDSDITTIATNMATAGRSEKKRLETTLGEVISERDDNVRNLGEEKQRFYAELDKSKHDEIAKTSASTDYTNRYADYRQSLYSLTNAEPSDDVTEKLAEAEKSEYALLQTIIPNVDSETKSVLQPIYSELDAKYGNISHTELVDNSRPLSNTNPPTEPVEVKDNETSTQNAQQHGQVEGYNDENPSGYSLNSQQLKSSVTRQSDISNRIIINASEISAIEDVLATSAGSDKKRLQTELGEITAECNDNVRSLSEEKQHFYAEIDKLAHDAIARSDVSSEYTSRYAAYRQTLYNLTNAEQSGADMSQKLADAEKAEYALLQTIIPNVDSETRSILQPIYNGLDAKYYHQGGGEVADVIPETYSQSMNFQEQMVRNIDISTREIERLEQRKEVARKSEQRRISDDISREESQKVDDIQRLAVEKSKFYSDLNSSLENILPSLTDSARQEYKLAYDSYNETLTTMKIGLGFYDMRKANKIYENAEIEEYKLLQQMKQVATGENKVVVDNMISRMEDRNSVLRRYKVVVDFALVDSPASSSSASGKVTEKADSVVMDISSSSTVLASTDSTNISLTPKKKSMSGYSSDSYGIYEKPEINMGLYYRIQIVAANVKYRMPYFNGLSLIFTEMIPNTSIIRYMTGEYYKYVSAREDLPKVRGLGFSDAFIVAYYNGKRISIGEARRLEALQDAEENEEIPVVIRHEAPADYVEPETIIASAESKSGNISNVENNTSVENNVANRQIVSDGNAEVSSDNGVASGQIVSGISVIDTQSGNAIETHEIPSKGVYYAVQIGVYKDRRQPSQLKGVSPVDYEQMPNGFIRHTSGRFGNYDQARASQMNIRRQGISDAFVIAYIDGRKVSFSEAVEYQKSMAARVVDEANAENNAPKSQGATSSEENLSNVEYAPLNLNTGTEENNKEGISYYVQIGAFSKSPDPEILSVFSKVAGDKIHVKFPREGLQIYRIGVFNSYEEAQNTLAEARSFGIVDAFIVAFKGEEQISSSEAIRLQNAVRQIENNSGSVVNNNAESKSTQSVQPTSSAEPKPVVPAETLQQAAGGVEYFVQLGAFVNMPDVRSMATFRSVASNTGARLSTVHNGRFTNYRVGAFKKFDDVKAAVDAARSMGVTDAFVVAFYNGERIPVAEAKEKE